MLGSNNANIKAVITAEDRASSVLSGFGSNVDSLANSAKTAVNRISKAFVVAGAAAATFAIKSAADFEQSRIAFETMLGSADGARKMLKDLSEFARKTPFELPEVVTGAKQLLAYGISAEKILPNLRALGDIAAGVGKDKLPQLTLAFGQVATKGKLFGNEIRQFTEAGVPLVQELAKTLGKTTEEIYKMSESGQISFPQVETALTNMTKSGGRFFNLMDRQSTTFSGVLSNLRDNLGRFARTIVGISEEGDIKEGSIFARLRDGAIKLLTWLDSNKEKIVESVQRIVDRMIEAVSKFIQHVKSDGFAQAFSDALGELMAKIDWSGLAMKAVMLFVVIAPQIIEGFIRGLIEAAKQNPLDFLVLFAALGFLPAVVTGALATVLSGIPIVGPLLGWVTRAFAATASAATAPVAGMFSTLGATAAGAIVTGFVGAAAIGFGTIYSTISSMRGVIDSEIKRLSGQIQPQIDALRKMGKNAEADKLQNLLNQTKKGPGGPLSFLPGFAAGGQIGANQASIVGEKGPELFIPNQSGTIVPNNKMASTVNINVNVGMYAGTELEKRKIAESLFRSLKDVASAKSTTLESMMR